MGQVLVRALGTTLALLLAAGCPSGPERELRATTLGVASQLNSPRFWLIAGDAEQVGGSLVTSLIAGLPPRQHGVGVAWGETDKPFSVVVREPSAGIYVVDGYAEDLHKPRFSERAARPPPMKLP